MLIVDFFFFAQRLMRHVGEPAHHDNGRIDSRGTSSSAGMLKIGDSTTQAKVLQVSMRIDDGLRVFGLWIEPEQRELCLAASGERRKTNWIRCLQVMVVDHSRSPVVRTRRRRSQRKRMKLCIFESGIVGLEYILPSRASC